MVLAFNKPYGVLSQFTPDAPGQRTLKAYGFPKGVYAVGRLDADSEGLLLLSDEQELNRALLHPTHKHVRRYWAQVERMPSDEQLQAMEQGLDIQGRKTFPCKAWILNPEPEIAPRDPPIRFRKSIETCWIALELVEGKNRQVRRMTAAIGHPTLRLIRVRIGQYNLETTPGAWKVLSPAERKLLFA